MPVERIKSSDEFVEMDSFSDPAPLDEAVQAAVKSRPIFRDISDVATGLFKSRIFRTVLNTALAGLAIGVIFLLFSNPIGWIATAAGVSLLAAKLIFAGGSIALFAALGALAQFPRGGTMEFEISALKKLLQPLHYNEIPVQTESGHRLFLGAIPNALRHYEEMQEVVGNGTVIAVMEDWELTAQGLSIPITKEDYKEAGVRCFVSNQPDHLIISREELDRLADKVNEALENGNVYVHCKGGAGRSAAAVAAYLMKYEGYSIVDACALIKGHRDKSTIWNKLNGLREYQDHLFAEHNIHLAPLPPHVSAAANTLMQMEESGKRAKLPKTTIAKLQSEFFAS
jgi:protein-tyrosine phosphatase